MAGLFMLLPYTVSTGTGGSNDSLNRNSGLEEKVESQDNFFGDEQKGYGDTVINGIRLKEPVKNFIDEGGKKTAEFVLPYEKRSTGYILDVVKIRYEDDNEDGEYDQIWIKNTFTQNKGGSISVVNFCSRETIGVSSPFDYKIRSRGVRDNNVLADSASRKYLYERNLESRFPSDKDLQNFIFDDRIKAIRDAFEAYNEQGRVEPTYDLLYNEFKTWQINLNSQATELRSIETGVPEAISQEVIYPFYK